ncbi:replicative DNA helicase [Orientia tsutsugamushi]|uniref:Replicative DNA helicase n=1 Tax=Orientia tsutsugamushi TaxID=784 RepID=A0A2R8F4C4_ORITS|nr:replicative DNA helicase [Orientia tsutsugamushi]
MEKDLAKIAPSNIQAEQMILGAILINNRALYNRYITLTNFYCQNIFMNHYMENIQVN